jgi:hypothetical protein
MSGRVLAGSVLVLLIVGGGIFLLIAGLRDADSGTIGCPTQLGCAHRPGVLAPGDLGDHRPPPLGGR